MRALAAAAVLASLATITTAASAEEAPLPLASPTGYRDYCDGIGRNRICPSGGVPPEFWRPLLLPRLAPGNDCPVTRPRVLKGLGPVFGAGPVSITHVNPWRVSFPPPENSVAAGSGWSIDKTPLVMGKRFRGSFAVRGRRLDGPGALGFAGPRGRRPFEAMQFAAGRLGAETAGYRFWPVGVWMTTPGCYALQLDGESFSRVIVFRVEAAPSGRVASRLANRASSRFAFGRTGGNIIPFSVTIGADGRITARGPVQVAHPSATVSTDARAGLLRLARAEGFFKLPNAVACPATLPDVASMFISVTQSSVTKTVTVHGDCNAGFAELYAVLSAVAGVRG